MADGSFAALVLTEQDGRVAADVRQLDAAELPAGEVEVRVEYSDLNYKDAMILQGLGRLVRQYPHVPGIDFAGTVLASRDARYKPGDAVILTGWRVGETHWGGYAQRARVKADWLVPLPTGMTTRDAMAIGTAGLTAMLAVTALEEHGLTRGAGPVLVTGAAGGLGSVAVAILAKLGHAVTAVTGRPEQSDYLKGLGAAEILERQALATPTPRPLEPEAWAGAIDSVGGSTLARLLGQLRYRTAAAACGLTAGNTMQCSLLPFLLRGVNLLGIDSAMHPHERRVRAWQRLVVELPKEKLAAITSECGLAELPARAEEILAGRLRGRLVVDVNR